MNLLFNVDTMSFWRSFGFHPISHIENELLQECKSQNKRLIEFLIKPESLAGLFEYITKEAPEEAERKRKESYPFLASEILCMDIQSLIDAVYKDDQYLNQLYEYLDKPNFNLGLAAHTSKVAINFLGRKTIETMSYIKKQENIIEKFIKHLDKSPVVDILLKIISIEEFPGGAGTLEWLDKCDLIGGIISKFDPSLDSEFHENASFILCEIVELTRSFSDSPLLERLESDEIIKKLYQFILSDIPLGTTFLHGLTVIIRLLRRHKDNNNNDTIATPLEELLPLFSESIVHIVEFNNLLKQTGSTSSTGGQASSENNSFTTTTGLLSPPLGFHRLKVIEFFADLINSRYLCIDKKIVELDILSSCLELFFSYPWNNLLHSQIHQICQIILYSENDELKVSLLKEAKLLDRIIEADEQNTKELKQAKGIRYGYMGFLNSIAQSICEVAKSVPQLKDILDNNDRWNQFVSESLLPVLHIEGEPLGEFRPSLMIPPETEEDDDDPYENEQDTYQDENTSEYVNSDENHLYQEEEEEYLQSQISSYFSQQQQQQQQDFNSQPTDGDQVQPIKVDQVVVENQQEQQNENTTTTEQPNNNTNANFNETTTTTTENPIESTESN
ncbi:hypothetical protein DLAC_01935 [Tieghemostelium lacteum]|uniref:SIT4 phosphatase-associated family protein n=1 Tax=Tieghemostelium lacteum TaxID=361077 RepID=A0A152A5G3_TIELA|nr:hypothetical protein DLAC_01935 [Tieghemostelium lacteum]|eukprot:KYR01345.1 hypothetical protein DLAC_01935 [Tieghemostelium lacteum]